MEKRNANITVIPFLQPEELRRELLKGGVGCLPTHKDQWGVVLHEFALMGLPILASTGCGAVTEFLISGFNGYTFKKGDAKDLSRKLLAFTKLADSEYKLFSDNSRSLSSRISTESSSASLMSVLDR